MDLPSIESSKQDPLIGVMCVNMLCMLMGNLRFLCCGLLRVYIGTHWGSWERDTFVDLGTNYLFPGVSWGNGVPYSRTELLTISHSGQNLTSFSSFLCLPVNRGTIDTGCQGGKSLIVICFPHVIINNIPFTLTKNSVWDDKLYGLVYY